MASSHNTNPSFPSAGAPGPRKDGPCPRPSYYSTDPIVYRPTPYHPPQVDPSVSHLPAYPQVSSVAHKSNERPLPHISRLIPPPLSQNVSFAGHYVPPRPTPALKSPPAQAATQHTARLPYTYTPPRKLPFNTRIVPPPPLPPAIREFPVFSGNPEHYSNWRFEVLLIHDALVGENTAEDKIVRMLYWSLKEGPAGTNLRNVLENSASQEWSVIKLLADLDQIYGSPNMNKRFYQSAYASVLNNTDTAGPSSYSSATSGNSAGPQSTRQSGRQSKHTIHPYSRNH